LKENNLNAVILFLFMNKDLIKKIIQKKEFSKLPEKDVQLAFEKFNQKKYLDSEKVKLTRSLLRSVFSAFASQRIFSLKNRDADWVLKKHFSTRERLNFYEDVYRKILGDLDKNISVIDLGAGVNGFSYKYFLKCDKRVKYLAVEAMGQFVDLMNSFFKKGKIDGRAVHLSLFELERIKDLIKKMKKPRVVFLFKVIDSMEVLKRDYSKELLTEIAPLVDRIVISFATESMVKRMKFKVSRKWILDFVRKNFCVLDDFEEGGERYIVFCGK
jgi:hypothetical protein